MKSFDIYVENYIDENMYTVYIHHGGGADELVHPIEVAEDLSVDEAQSMTKDLIARYSLHGEVRVLIYEYEEVINLKNIRILSAEEFKQISL